MRGLEGCMRKDGVIYEVPGRRLVARTAAIFVGSWC